MSTETNTILFERGGQLLPFLNTTEAKRLNKYIEINDLESFANFVRVLEIKYQINTGVSDSKPVQDVSDAELDKVLSKRIKHATDALNKPRMSGAERERLDDMHEFEDARRGEY